MCQSGGVDLETGHPNGLYFFVFIMNSEVGLITLPREVCQFNENFPAGVNAEAKWSRLDVDPAELASLQGVSWCSFPKQRRELSKKFRQRPSQ